MESKVTAVQWLQEKYNKNINLIPANFEEALAMEKEQIIDAYKSDRHPCSDEDAEQYYNETFTEK